MLIPVILAGGLGTRLWPVSRPEHPKPLARLTGRRSLLQETVLRAKAIPGASDPVIVCGQAHFPSMAGQLDEIGASACSVLLEPVGRGTAPAAAAAALMADEDDLVAILPADHLIEDIDAFAEGILQATHAARDGWLVTFGITPDRPETGYGYIERGEPTDNRGGAYRIVSFREKPDLLTASRYVESGRYSWNSGMFLFGAGAFLDELRSFRREMVSATEAALAAAASSGQNRLERGTLLLDPEAFAACPSGSIDRTVMEGTRRGAMVPLDAGWSDMGTWAALWKHGTPDPSGNVVTGPAHLQDVISSYVLAGERPVLVIGLEGVIVVDAGDAVLVAGMDHAQQVAPVKDPRPDSPTDG